MSDAKPAERQAIAELQQNWGFWRDNADWDNLRATFHAEGTISVTWFQGLFRDFVDASIELRKKPRRSRHWIGGSLISLCEARATAETNVVIMGRQQLHGVEVDSTCWARFHDLLERRAGRWAICRRVAIYDKDRIDPVVPGATIAFDDALLARFPGAYRYLGYALTCSAGAQVALDLPTGDGDGPERLRAEGRAWLAQPDR